MSNGMNRVTLLGNLGQDPDLRIAPGGTCVLKLRLATTEAWFDKEGVLQDRTEWHDVTVFGKRGEALARILGKGETIIVEGSLRTSSYEKEGVKRYRTEVIARDVFLTGRPRSTAAQLVTASPLEIQHDTAPDAAAEADTVEQPYADAAAPEALLGAPKGLRRGRTVSGPDSAHA